MRTMIDEEGFYRGMAVRVRSWQDDSPSGSQGFAVVWQGRTAIGIFFSKEIANAIAATFDALTPEDGSVSDPPYDALMELVGFRLILAEVVAREAHRLAEQEEATRSAARRLRGRSWP